MALIFIVEDNESIREAASSYLRLEDHEVLEFSKAGGVLDAAKMKNPDLIVLDVMLPDGDGFQLAKRIRGHSDVPILFLTARVSESDRITGLEIGADDYVTKPFSPKELVLRIGAILKRTRKKERSTGGGWVLGGDILEIDEGSHRVFVNRSEVSLTAAEWKILLYLVKNPGLVITRDRILGNPHRSGRGRS